MKFKEKKDLKKKKQREDITINKFNRNFQIIRKKYFRNQIKREINTKQIFKRIKEVKFIKKFKKIRIIKLIIISIRINLKINFFNKIQIINSTKNTTKNKNKSLMNFKIFKNTKKNLKFQEKPDQRRDTSQREKKQRKKNSKRRIHFKKSIKFMNKKKIIIITFNMITNTQEDQEDKKISNTINKYIIKEIIPRRRNISKKNETYM